MAEGMFAGFEFGTAADLGIPMSDYRLKLTNDAPPGFSVESAEVAGYLWCRPDDETPLRGLVVVPGQAVNMILLGVDPPYDILKRIPGVPGWHLIYEVRPTASGYVVWPVGG